MRNEEQNEMALSLIEKFVVWMLIIDLLLGKWIANIPENKYIYFVIVSYFVYIFINGTYSLKKSDLITICTVITMLFINILINGKGNQFVTNGILYGVGNLLIIKFFVQLFQTKKQYMQNIFVPKLRKIFNIYFWINSIVMYKQLNGTYFLMRYYENNSMYEDHITGFIGASGTHRLTLFWIALLIFNINYYLENRKRTVLIITVIQLTYMITISAYNDNTIFYFLMPLVLVELYGVRIVQKIKLKKIFSILIITFILISIFNYLKTLNSELNEFLNTRVLEKTYQLVDSEKNYNDDEERIELFKYALEYGNGYKFGMGIGNVSYADSRLPNHFGMSEISIKTYEGGLVYLFELILLYSAYIYILIINNNEFKRKKLLFAIIFLNVVIMAAYTQIFRIPQLIEGMVLISIGVKVSKNSEEAYSI